MTYSRFEFPDFLKVKQTESLFGWFNNHFVWKTDPAHLTVLC